MSIIITHTFYEKFGLSVRVGVPYIPKIFHFAHEMKLDEISTWHLGVWLTIRFEFRVLGRKCVSWLRSRGLAKSTTKIIFTGSALFRASAMHTDVGQLGVEGLQGESRKNSKESVIPPDLRNNSGRMPA